MWRNSDNSGQESDSCLQYLHIFTIFPGTRSWKYFLLFFCHFYIPNMTPCWSLWREPIYKAVNITLQQTSYTQYASTTLSLFINCTARCWSFRLQEHETKPCGSAEYSTAVRWERDWHQRDNSPHCTFTVSLPFPSLRLPACLDLWHDYRLVKIIQRNYK